MPPSWLKRREQLHSLYGFDFPDDLFHFWAFANRLRPLEPLAAFAETLGVTLVGPFDALAGRFDGRSPRLSPLLHWRYYLDPPEFFTVLAGGTDRLHYGYYLDDPADGRGCVASYYASDAFELAADGDTLFEAVRMELETQYDFCETERPVARAEQLDRLRQILQKYATADRPERGALYVDTYQGKAARTASVIARTPDGMGVVAPPDTYRPLTLLDKKLRSFLRKQDDPLEIVEEARQALRDGFPATALKLGKELWPMYGERKTAYAYELLDAAYEALGRETLRKVLRVHRDNRNLPSVDIFSEEV